MTPAFLARWARSRLPFRGESYWDLDIQDQVGGAEIEAALKHRFPQLRLTPYAFQVTEVMGIAEGSLNLEQHLAGPPRFALYLPYQPAPKEVEACLRRRFALFRVAVLSRHNYQVALAKQVKAGSHRAFSSTELA